MTGRNSEIYSDRNPEMNCGYNLLEKSRNKIQEEMFQQYMDNLLQKFFEKKKYALNKSEWNLEMSLTRNHERNFKTISRILMDEILLKSQECWRIPGGYAWNK